jgi:hypothetical protein
MEKGENDHCNELSSLPLLHIVERAAGPPTAGLGGEVKK